MRTHPSLKIMFALTMSALVAAFARADTYHWTNFQSDIPGVALHTDPNLVNPWGMGVSSSGTIVVADNGTGVATAYFQSGAAFPNSNQPLVIRIPSSATNTEGANPTGLVANNTAFFKVSNGTNSLPAKVIFVSEDGSISGWNPQLNAGHAFIAVDDGASGAIYKGATLGVANGHNFLYVTNFHAGEVETYDENFNEVSANFPFADPNLPAGYAPFGIRNFNGKIFVTYAKQDADKEDDVAGAGFGFIDVFNTNGQFQKRLVSRGRLNAPWGLALVEGDELWVGNFGDGRINNYDPTTGAFLGPVNRTDGTPLQFQGLWDMLVLGNGVYFSAGIVDEEHGLFGLIIED